MELWIERGIFMWPCIGFCSLALLNPHGASAVPKGQWWLSNMWWITVMFCGFDFSAWVFTCPVYATDQLQSPHSSQYPRIRHKKTKRSTRVQRKLLTCVNALCAFVYKWCYKQNPFYTVYRPVLMRHKTYLWFWFSPSCVFSFRFYAHYCWRKSVIYKVHFFHSFP